MPLSVVSDAGANDTATGADVELRPSASWAVAVNVNPPEFAGSVKCVSNRPAIAVAIGCVSAAKSTVTAQSAAERSVIVVPDANVAPDAGEVMRGTAGL